MRTSVRPDARKSRVSAQPYGGLPCCTFEDHPAVRRTPYVASPSAQVRPVDHRDPHRAWRIGRSSPRRRGLAHQAAAANLAATPAGRHVTAMFESILNTAPTQQQVTQWVHELRAGTPLHALKRQLTVEARAAATTKAAVAADPTCRSRRRARSPSAAPAPPGRASPGSSARRMPSGPSCRRTSPRSACPRSCRRA